MFARLLFAASVMLFQSQSARCEAFDWQIKPDYSTVENRSFSLEITDEQHVPHVMYTDSRAVLIMESKYEDGNGWDSVVEPAKENEKLLLNGLEARGFHVDIWRNLKSKDLKTVLSDVFSAYGNVPTGRLFLYYYGHGYELGSAADPAGTRTFLVPVDSPNPAKDENSFRSKAFYISQLVEYAKQATTKHIFIALEACYAGDILSSLGGDKFAKTPKGYLLSAELQNLARQILTAGSRGKEVLAKSDFTRLIADGLSNADFNDDGYVTGTELMQYVATKLPQRDPGQKPEHDDFMHQDGDTIFGAKDPGSHKEVQDIAIQAPQFPLCRHPDHGLEGWANSSGWAADSDWRGGGSDPQSFCNSQKVQRERAFPDRNVTLVKASEDHRAVYNPFKHDEYRYTCQFLDQWGPIYKEARSPSCGHM